MPSIRSADPPEDSLLRAKVEDGDFLDCFVVKARIPARDAAEIVTNFPPWARLLVWLRNLLVSPFGLLSEGPPAPDRIGLFPIDQETPKEVLAGFNDRHLDFRVSVFSTGEQVFLATWVRPHNLGGRLYLNAILPFHVLIARNALARVARMAATLRKEGGEAA